MLAQISRILVFLLIIFSIPITSPRCMELDEVEPTLGKLGEELKGVRLYGDGFSEDMLVSLSMSRFLTGSVDLSHPAKAVAAFGSKAYVAAGVEGIRVVDISNPRRPLVEEIIGVDGNACEVAAIGTTVIVGLGDEEDRIEEIKAFDFGRSPVAGLWTINNASGSEDFAILGQKLYVAAGPQGVKVLDLENPQYDSAAVIPGTEGAYALAIEAMESADRTLAYVAVSEDTINIIRLNRDDPVGGNYLSSLSGTFASIIALGAIDESLYVIYDGISGGVYLDIFAPSDDDQMEFVMSMNLEHATDIDLINHALLVTRQDSNAEQAEFHLFNLNNSAIPRFAGTYPIGDGAYPKDVAVTDDQAFVLVEEGWVAIDIGDPIDSQREEPNRTRVDALSDPVAMVVQGDYAFIADRDRGLVILRTDNWTDHRLVDIEAVNGTALDLALGVNNSLLLLFGTGDGRYWVRGYDVSAPEQGLPRLQNDLEIPAGTNPKAIEFFEGSVFVRRSSTLLVRDYDDEVPGEWQTLSLPDDVFGSICGISFSAADKYAFITINYAEENKSWLWIIDADDRPQNFTYLTTVGLAAITGGAQGVVCHGRKAYVPVIGSWLGGLLAFDVRNPNRPYLFDRIITESNCRRVATSVDGKMVLLLNEGAGLISIPSPEIIAVDKIGPNGGRAQLDLPSPSSEGDFKLRTLTANGTYSELTGAITFRENAKLFESKAIIVAGGGPHAPNDLWDETKHCANLAYDALLKQGYTRDAIYYISMEPQTADVDRQNATLDNLEYALGRWLGDDTDELLVFFVDHGEPGEFILNVDQTDGVVTKLGADALANWLNRLHEEAVTGPQTFIYDACHSGSFLPKLVPSVGHERTLIVSCAARERAYFGRDGKASFSNHFWESIYAEGNLRLAFDEAENKMSNRQRALLDANGNGIPNEPEDYGRIDEKTLRRGFPQYLIQPTIQALDVRADPLNAKIIITARGVTDAQWVSAQIVPPDIDPQLTAADTDFDEIPLMREEQTDETGDYQGEFGDFSVNGTYIVSVRAGREQARYSYAGGGDYNHTVLSISHAALVNQTMGSHSAPGDEYDLTGDDGWRQAGRIMIADVVPQQHTFHVQDDEDWVRFYGLAGSEYVIETSSLSSIGDTTLTVFDQEGQTVIAGPVDAGGDGESETLSFDCEQDGIYAVRITSGNDNFGCSVRYELQVSYPPYGPLLSVLVSGRVLGPDRSPVPEVCISTSDGGSDISDEEGRFFIRHRAGQFTMTLVSDQFGTQSVSVDLVEGGGNYFEVTYGDDPPRSTDKPSSGGGGICFISNLLGRQSDE